MSSVWWIKIRTDMFSDEKIRLIEQLPESDGILVIWVKLLALAGQKNAGGEIFVNDEMPYTDEMLAAIFHRPVNLIRLALQTFQKFRMIEVAADQTIVISNWAKHQSVDALEKLKQQNTERQKRFREKQRRERIIQRLEETGEHLLPAAPDVTCNVTPRDAVMQNRVTSRSQIENRKEKNREEVPPTVPHRGTGEVLEFDPAKSFLHNLFGRKERRWSCEEDQLLSKVVPIPVADADLIKQWFELPGDHEVFAQRKDGESTRRKQELTTFLRDYNGELDKIHRFAPLFVVARRQPKNPPKWREFYRWKYSEEPEFELPPSWQDVPQREKEIYRRDFPAFEEARTKRWREFFRWKYPYARLPERFDELGWDQKEEYERDFTEFEKATNAA